MSTRPDEKAIAGRKAAIEAALVALVTSYGSRYLASYLQLTMEETIAMNTIIQMPLEFMVQGGAEMFGALFALWYARVRGYWKVWNSPANAPGE